MAELSDVELLEAARRGDDSALDALLARHQDRIFRFGMKLCGNREDAADVLQETLLAMARSVREFRAAASLSTWLYTIARNFCAKKRRRSKFAPRSTESFETSAAVTDAIGDPRERPDDALATKETLAALERAIAALEPDSREVFVLRDVEGLSAKETARVTGLSLAAVKSRLHRARGRVRDQLARALGTEAVAAPHPETCPDILSLYSRYLEDEIDRRICAEMQAHLHSCPRCTQTCDSLKRMLALCRTTPSVELPKELQRSIRESLRQLLLAPD
jgi:RNA polymerase sigma-70 factor (ECF subfamily)